MLVQLCHDESKLATAKEKPELIFTGPERHTASGRREPRLLGQPASPLDSHVLVRTALANSKADRHGLCKTGHDTRTHTLRWILLGRAEVASPYHAPTHGARPTVSELVPNFPSWC